MTFLDFNQNFVEKPLETTKHLNLIPKHQDRTISKDKLLLINTTTNKSLLFKIKMWTNFFVVKD